MPQFILDTGGAVTQSTRWGDLDAFTQGYIEAMFFTDSGPEEGQLGDAGFADITPEALQLCLADCDRFQEQHSELLAAACACEGYGEERAGHDFWLTRNGHGAGFWDRQELPGEVRDDLTAACGWQTAYGERWTSLDCNGKVHIS